MNKKIIPDDDIARTDRALNGIKKKFQIVKTGNSSLKGFEIYSSNNESEVLNSWKVFKPNNSFTICLIAYTHFYQYIKNSRGYVGGTASERNCYFYGYLVLTKDYGKTLIRPETLKDKILELFDPIELDFKEHKRFSRKYYVLSNDKVLFSNNIDDRVIEYIGSVNNLTIEFNGNKCLFRMPKSLDIRETLKLCEIGLNLDLILNN